MYILPSSGVHSAVALCDGFGMVGLGQVKSAARLDLQCGHVCSYKYHWCCRSNLGMCVLLGKMDNSSISTLVLRILI